VEIKPVNSSTSSSSTIPAPTDEPARAAARRWLAAFLATSAICFFGAAAFIVATDPYDTGRFALLKVRGLVDERPAFAAASRGRDPDFDAAIIGNSRAQMLDPSRLSDLTGRRFVQLSMQGAPVPVQYETARYFIEHHKAIPVAILFVIDDLWCTPGPAPPGFPFPLWLYGDNWSYLANVVGPDGLSKAVRRLGLALGLTQRSRPDGYDNVEERNRALWDSKSAAALGFQAAPPWANEDVGAPIPKVDTMRALLELASPGSRFVLLWTPYYLSALPAAGSPAEARLETCKQAYASLAASRHDTAVIDRRIRGPLAADASNFLDSTHIRTPLARMLEAAAAPALARSAAR
jgi:hypothetical protein